MEGFAPGSLKAVQLTHLPGNCRPVLCGYLELHVGRTSSKCHPCTHACTAGPRGFALFPAVLDAFLTLREVLVACPIEVVAKLTEAFCLLRDAGDRVEESIVNCHCPGTHGRKKTALAAVFVMRITRAPPPLCSW